LAALGEISPWRVSLLLRAFPVCAGRGLLVAPWTPALGCIGGDLALASVSPFARPAGLRRLQVPGIGSGSSLFLVPEVRRRCSSPRCFFILLLILIALAQAVLTRRRSSLIQGVVGSVRISPHFPPVLLPFSLLPLTSFFRTTLTRALALSITLALVLAFPTLCRAPSPSPSPSLSPSPAPSARPHLYHHSRPP
jgi:hypothetical protein